MPNDDLLLETPAWPQELLQVLATRSPSPASQPTPQPVFVSPLLISPLLGPGTPRRSARGGQSRCAELLMEGHGTGTRRRPATCLSQNGHPRHADGTRMWCTSSPLHANLGVTGPRDPVSGRGDMPSMPMIHRTHLDIFDGKSLPDSFQNWYNDVWLGNVYRSVLASSSPAPRCSSLPPLLPHARTRGACGAGMRGSSWSAPPYALLLLLRAGRVRCGD
jgi:hypothetical protein